jgi:hypothetical protein
MSWKNKEYEPARPDSVQYEPLDDNVGNLRPSMYAGSFRDVGYAVAFVAHYLAVCVLAGVFHSSVDTGSTNLDGKIMSGVGAALGMTIAFSVLWLVMIRMCARVLLWVSILFSLGLTIATAIFFFYIGSAVSGLIFLLLAAIQVCWIWCVRSRIAMAAAMLEITVEVQGQFWGMYVASVFMIAVTAGIIALWGYSAYVTFEQANSDNARYGIALFFLFSLLWIINVKRYIVHCTGAGATGSWYFSVSELDPASISQAGTSAGSLCRALTSSFGSVCYGALIITIIEMMKLMARSLRDRDNNAFVQFIGCCLECILQCIEDIVEYINSYAFTICAIYGDDYCSAVSKTMGLFSSNGFDLIINDDLIESVLFMGALACGAVGAGSAYFVARDSDDNEKITCAVAGFVIGIGMMSIVNALVVSCVKSLYVCFAQDPLVLYNTKRSKYDKLTRAWMERWPEGIPCQAYLDVAMSTHQPYPAQAQPQRYAPQNPQAYGQVHPQQPPPSYNPNAA